MFSYVLRRLLLMIPTVIGITMVVFFTMALAPGGVGASLLNAQGAMRPDERKALTDYYNRRYGLDKPLVVQYARWLNQVSPIGFQTTPDGARGPWRWAKWPNLGESLVRHRPVVELIKEAIPITLLLNLLSIPLIYGLSVTAGIYAARYRGKWFDVASGITFVALWSMPTMWVAVVLIGFFANRDHFQFFPTSGLHDAMAEQMPFLPATSAGVFQRGWLLDTAWHLLLPLLCMTYGGMAYLSKLMRSAVLENLSADFVRTARAKGVSGHVVLFRHVLRNSILPLITVASGILPSLLGGSIIIESIFSLNGMGKLMVDAVFLRDYELVLAETLVIGIISTLSLLMADLSYAIADPRVSYE